MKYLVVIEESAQGFGAHVPDLPGCVAAGKTREEVMDLIREAIRFHIEGLEEDDMPLPPPASSGEVVEIGLA